MNKEQEDFLYKVEYFKEMIDHSYRYAIEAYEVIEKYDGDIKYQMSLSYFVMSNQNYIEARRIYIENKMEYYEVDAYMKAYEHYLFQLKEVISNKDTNTSWLYSAKSGLEGSKKDLNEFIKGIC